MKRYLFIRDWSTEATMDELYFDNIFSLFSKALEDKGMPLPSVSTIAAEDSSPYRVLVSTIISLRTKDSVTLSASRALFRKAPDVFALASMDAEDIGETIKPAGFYRRKGEQLKRIAGILIEEYGGEVPDDMERLLSLPGVGLKTASLVLNLGFGIDAICVDCHVHQIANRIGWVSASTPEETEKELRGILPRRFWIPLNELLVSYGQKICTPVSPFCSQCPISGKCPKIGVERSR